VFYLFVRTRISELMRTQKHSWIYYVGLLVQAVLYIGQGINHFWHSAMVVGLMPMHYAHPYALVLLSGSAEILGGIGLLVEGTRRMAAWGLILMLVIYFDVHISMLMHAGRFPSIPLWLLYARIPFQFVFIAWAWAYTRGASDENSNSPSN
jgi:uncharacterized membrane protein